MARHLSLLLLIPVFGWIGLTLGCRSKPRPVGIVISAAISLQFPLESMEATFEQAHPEIDLIYNFGSSGSLRAQIENGAPVDGFLSANRTHYQKLARAGLVHPESGEAFAHNAIVLGLAVAEEGAASPASAWDQVPWFSISRLAIGEPNSAPVGYYAREALESIGVWERISGRLILGKSARQVYTWLSEGTVDAACLYQSDARRLAPEFTIIPAPPESHEAVTYLAGIVEARPHAGQVRVFLDFLQSSEARAVFREFGFIPARQNGG